MAIYNINLGIGWASSGVEYAQAYRAKIYRKLGVESKFIFTDFFNSDNIIELTRNIGFIDDEIIWLYTFFTDQKISTSSFTAADLKETFTRKILKEEKNDNTIRFYFSDNDFVTAYYSKSNNKFIHCVEWVSDGHLLRKDFFTAKKKMYSEYFVFENNVATLIRRSFYNIDGTIAYNELLQKEVPLYQFPNGCFYSKMQLVEYFMKKLKLKSNDIVILDRSTDIGQVIFKNVQPAKLGVIIHADHFSENSTTDSVILWNNYYEYQFTNFEFVDFYVVATDIQKKLLLNQFKKYKKIVPEIKTIPVGSLSELKIPDFRDRKPFSLITASRLATEKHVDWLTKAVIKAKKEIKGISFDIYGYGSEMTKIQNIISINDAESYIRLLGHQNLEEVYQSYQVYITASTSEGFGLTLLEAIGSGLPIIGFDVRYGNQNFIKDGKTGYLVDYPEGIPETEIVDSLYHKIIRMFKHTDIKQLSENSYQLAENYLEEKIEKKWLNLIKEMVND